MTARAIGAPTQGATAVDNPQVICCCHGQLSSRSTLYHGFGNSVDGVVAGTTSTVVGVTARRFTVSTPTGGSTFDAGSKPPTRQSPTLPSGRFFTTLALLPLGNQLREKGRYQAALAVAALNQ